jgi:hypothetical protein
MEFALICRNSPVYRVRPSIISRILSNLSPQQLMVCIRPLDAIKDVVATLKTTERVDHKFCHPSKFKFISSFSIEECSMNRQTYLLYL